MAALKLEVKAFIIQSVACIDTPSQVVDAVPKEFSVAQSKFSKVRPPAR